VIGQADLTTASELKTALLDALSTSSKSVEIDLTQATALNVTCFQLIWAANAESAARGASLRILASRDPAVLDYLREAGLYLPAETSAEVTTGVCA
jgi:anti-anti-sigma regulatory factor